MENIRITTFLFLFALGVHKICVKSESTEIPTAASQPKPNPLATLLLDKNVIENVNNSNRLADEVLSRVRRQYGYDPYYRRRYPTPPVIFIGGGFGGGGFGRGFGGGGFGGRGYGGRGFGGRGFGGRGFGGRGIGGRGGGFGGGHGGRG